MDKLTMWIKSYLIIFIFQIYRKVFSNIVLEKTGYTLFKVSESINGRECHFLLDFIKKSDYDDPDWEYDSSKIKNRTLNV